MYEHSTQNMIHLQLANAGMFKNIPTILSLDVVPINVGF
jgi:hypothetical protein